MPRKSIWDGSSKRCPACITAPRVPTCWPSMNHASYLRPVGVSTRSIRGARSLNRGSIRLVYRSGGSMMCESAEMSLSVVIAHLLSIAAPRPAGPQPRDGLQRALPQSDQWEPCLTPHVVDDLEHARAQRWILDPELLAEAAVVHQVVAGLVAAAVLLEGDLRVREKLAHDVRELAQAHRDPARVVEVVAGRVGQQHTGEDLGDVLDVDQEPHETLARKLHGLAPGGVDHERHVIRRAADFVRAGDVGGAHARDRHRVVLDVLLRLELVEDLVDGVLARAGGRVVLGHLPGAGGALLPPHPDRARGDHALGAAHPRGLEAVVHPQDVPAPDLMRGPLPRPQPRGPI